MVKLDSRLFGILSIGFFIPLVSPTRELKSAEQPVRFSLQIRPLLAEKCFFCHGPDEKHREADLRLDDENSAKAARDGATAIVPGDLNRSEAWQRIISDDPTTVMPPADSNRTLTTEQKELIRLWISQGASWGKHWSFEPPAAVETASSPSAGIDELVAAKLKERGLGFAPRASMHTLARRLSLDLIGLPPTPEQADELAAAAASDFQAAMEQFVDRLLDSNRFGEHWARMWLDLARYADTKGYEKDLGRDMWLYRDWVINALNADMPFDRFTVEQLAGDLIPQATKEQIIATAFHRNTMTNDEGGTDNEEFRVSAVKDRVDTTIQVWMGLTVGCAKCHSHKYDPISMEDYYRFYAILNQTTDADLSDDAPRLTFATAQQEQKQAELAADVKAAQQKVAALRKDEAKNASEEPADGDSTELADAKKALKAARDKAKEFNATVPSVPVMRELEQANRRVTKIHVRGNFLEPGAEVQPAVLPGFGALTDTVKTDAVTTDAVTDRLVAAKWLVSPDNPLTARVMVNRVWARLFGVGIVETEEDFGSQGAFPTHPELLDALAVHYRDKCGWSLKKLLKTIVLSRTYQQAYLLDNARKEFDPRNVWLSRAPRMRLSAEMIRDQALAVSGLLSGKIGGRSVMPPQPDGLWKSTYNAAKWVTASGEDRYRRGLYTYWKRTTPYPSMITFDAGSREVCQIRRIQTNTPLQALVTMNDPVYLEAAAALAKRMVADAADDRGRAERGWRLAMIRPARSEEIDSVVGAFRDAREVFQADVNAGARLLEQCNTSAPSGIDVPTFASWTLAASVVLNLDEFVMR